MKRQNNVGQNNEDKNATDRDRGSANPFSFALIILPNIILPSFCKSQYTSEISKKLPSSVFASPVRGVNKS